ncbi:histone-lysine N-methyltransferase SMYD3 isoform 2-T2 [Discoglossus pictus]
MARKLEKFYSPGKGNGLRATEALSLGTLVSSAQPYVYTVCRGKSREAACDHCLRRKEKLLRCSQCKFARYCDARCQLQQPDSPSDDLYSVSDLQSHIKELSAEMKDGLRHLAITLELYLKQEIQDASQLPPGFNILEYFGKVTCNSFTISDGEMQDVAVGLYPSMSLLNHSCDPNCVIVFEGKCLLLRTVKEIPKGEELTISYIDVKMPTHMRQAQLQRQYCFMCNCHRCLQRDKDEDMLAGDEQASKEAEGSIARLEELQSQDKGQEVLELCKSLISSNSSQLPDKNIHQLKILDFAMDAGISLGLWEEALYFGLRTLEPYSLYYSNYHPVRAIQMMKVGKIQNYLGMFPEAMQILKQAFEIMKITHGSDHTMTQDLMKLLRECEVSMSK